MFTLVDTVVIRRDQNLYIVNFTRIRKQAERWGAELFQEDVELIDVKNIPFTVQSSERKVMLPFSSGYLISYCSIC